MKRIILFFVCCTALLGSLRAQEDSKYLLGAVPVGEDGLGKVERIPGYEGR